MGSVRFNRLNTFIFENTFPQPRHLKMSDQPRENQIHTISHVHFVATTTPITNHRTPRKKAQTDADSAPTREPNKLNFLSKIAPNLSWTIVRISYRTPASTAAVESDLL